jgi:zinc transport system permease protein
MLEILSYTFIKNAIIAGVLVSIISGIIGSLIVVNRMVFLAGGIAHSAYGGIGISIYFALPMLLSTTIYSVLVAAFIAMITYNNRHKLDTIIGLTWAMGMSLGILLVNLTPGYNVNLMSYLFGSILSVNSNDIIFMSSIFILIILLLVFFYRDILAVSYDSAYANIRGVQTKIFYTLILIIASISIVIAIKIVGLILVIALLSIPTFIAEKFASSLLNMMIYSSCFSIFFTLSGLVLSYSYDLSSGPSIILISSSSMILVILYEKIQKFVTKK